MNSLSFLISRLSERTSKNNNKTEHKNIHYRIHPHESSDIECRKTNGTSESASHLSMISEGVRREKIVKEKQQQQNFLVNMQKSEFAAVRRVNVKLC